MFKKMPIVLLGLFILIIGINPYLPLEYKSVLFAVSLSIKSVLMFLLPFLIFALLFKTAVEFSRSATRMILLLLLAICCSNFISTMLSYCVGHLVYQFDLSLAFPQEQSGLAPAWAFVLPQWIKNSHALAAGLILGAALGRFRPKLAEEGAHFLGNSVNKILKVFLTVMPLFIGGYLLKLASDGLMGTMIRNYAVIFLLIASAQFSYVFLLYFIACRREKVSFVQSIKNMIPAAIAGFGTMSSAAALPLTLAGAAKNSCRPDLAKAIIPATVNVHLVGDCLAIPIFAFAVLKNFSIGEPSLFVYLIFALYFVVAKFSVAAIPGGGILIMLPILESYLGFNAEMMSLITALYILFDPVITCANVMGNGVFSMVMSRQLSGIKAKA